MAHDSTIVFTRLADGTLLRRDPDGNFRPIASETDLEAVSHLTDDVIETMAASDPDHPALDDRFWREVDRRDESANVALDPDVATFFREGGGRYEERVNAVLRGYIEAQKRARS
jgi:uncharacterized protein (DUF4415 family)